MRPSRVRILYDSYQEGRESSFRLISRQRYHDVFVFECISRNRSPAFCEAQLALATCAGVHECTRLFKAYRVSISTGCFRCSGQTGPRVGATYVMLDPSLAPAMPVHLSEMSAAKRRRSEESDAKRTHHQRDSDSDGAVPKHHHHHHHHHKKPAVKLDDESQDSVTGVCTLKEGSLKLKISLHRPPSSLPTTPDGDSLVPAPLSRAGDKDEKPVDNGVSDRQEVVNMEHAESNGVEKHVPLVLCTPKASSEQGREQEETNDEVQLSGRTTARKSKVPGHFVAPEPKTARRTLLPDLNKLRKPRTNQSTQPVAHRGDPKFRGTILDSGLLARPPDTFHHLQVTVGQNGGRGIVNHASILNHPSVHSRMFAESFSKKNNVRSPPPIGEVQRKPSLPAPRDHQPLDLSTAGYPNATVSRQKAATASYVPPIGVFYLKPHSRKRLDDVVKRLWARHGTNNQVPAVLPQAGSV
ncbi:uncharacterized protein LOC135389925 [Ornithodoros turicata]|uniref:uncharacterized protein LOC135389925 n=1 Tax=Ornithodoros turicata TaxID=34597 RepID=UPI00313866C2